MALSERVKKIGRFFREMQVVNLDGKTVIYVMTAFPHGWVIADDIEEKFGVNVGPGNTPGEFFFAADISDGEETVFDAIDYNITKMNEAIERATLLSEKTIELKRMFENEDIPIESLRNIRIVMDGSPDLSSIVNGRRGKRKTKTDEKKAEAMDDIRTETPAEDNQEKNVTE